MMQRSLSASTSAEQEAPSIEGASTSDKRLPRIAIFASGSGSNFQAIVDAAQTDPEHFGAVVALLVCDKPGAYVLERAKAAGIQSAVYTPKQYENRELYEQDLLQRLQAEGIEWIVLAGYMRIITHVLLEAYPGKMMNIHPSLLPSFPGLHAVKQALDYGVRVTGVTVHLVDAGMDTGPILAQHVVQVEAGDTEESLSDRIHAIEHGLYPAVICDVLAGRLAPIRV
ncbi:phosphoribosylglycinamide formyltransferase [Paenibacillus sp. UMB4589-SE434]|uniref:phosphoribosylglycinamide formyltransferase n=1 Tax=Paenibacillus sp. UMB4589-SE434 TaxID=3046314 RepID=UPI00254D244E|nr:phosphoribosylglycinamide formyltransferase [Paenibacillus sp. UMB4589-SE434]MDK8183391.1 phosphoribosylglycinamide formyltransferase [Paenibacillus sp. UMB4589-SE434]